MGGIVRVVAVLAVLLVEIPVLVGGQGVEFGAAPDAGAAVNQLSVNRGLEDAAVEMVQMAASEPVIESITENLTATRNPLDDVKSKVSDVLLDGLPVPDPRTITGIDLDAGPDDTRLPSVPSVFEPNLGQADNAAEFVAHTDNGVVLLGRTSTWFAHAVHESPIVRPFKEETEGPDVPGAPGRPEPGIASVEILEMRFADASPGAVMAGGGVSSGYSNHYSGASAADRLERVPHYATVTYQDLYPGIDIEFAANSNRTVSYTILVDPGADSRMVRFHFAGADDVRIVDSGDLVIDMPHASLRHSRPALYQVVAGERVPVLGSFELLNSTTVGFDVGAYDPTELLVIDPTVDYASYLGGGGTDIAYGVAIDDGAALYVTGQTLSTDFPLSSNPEQSSKAGQYDAFVTKISSGAITYSTYLGGSGDDFGQDVEVDPSLRAYVTGYTISTNFPTSLDAYQATRGGTNDAFVTKLTGDGFLDYSSYIGGHSDDRAFGAGIDDGGRVAIAGYSTSGSTFPVKNEYSSANLNRQSFVTVIDTAASGSASLVYSTLYGELGYETAYDAAFDPSGRIAIVGETDQNNLVTKAAGGGSAYQSSNAGLKDAFVAQFDPNSSGSASLRFATYYGGSSYDYGYGIATDGDGDVYITGAVRSSDLDVSGAPPGGSTMQGGTDDAVIAKLASDGASLRWASYIGGSARDWGNSIAVDDWENVYVAGTTYSTDLPQAENAHAKYADAFLTMVKYDASAILASRYFGGASNDDQGKDVDVEDDGWFGFAGRTASTNFDTTSPTQGDQGGTDGFIVRGAFNRRPTIPTNPSPGNGATSVVATDVTLSWDVDNPGQGSYDGVAQSTVYFDQGTGTPTTPRSNCDPTAAESCWVGDLLDATDYVWRVETCDELSCTEGPVWTFRTGVNTPPAPCMQITWNNVTAQMDGDASCTSDSWDSDGDLWIRWIWSNAAGSHTGVTDIQDYACLDETFSVTLNVTDTGDAAREIVREFDWGDQDGDGLAATCESIQGTVDEPSAAKPTWRTDVHDFDARDTDGDTLDDLMESQWNNQRDQQFCNGTCLHSSHYPDPNRKDVYVEMDYMAPTTTHLPQEPELQDIAAVYADSNVDSGRGIALHLDAGSARGVEFDLRGGEEIPHDNNTGSIIDVGLGCAYNTNEWYDLEEAYFDRDGRAGVFHWMFWGHSQESCAGGSPTGQGEASGTSFFITLPPIAPSGVHGSTSNQVATFVHELGHNHGLGHGGPGDNDNWKPNHPSVMNYDYSNFGVSRPVSFGSRYFGFSQVDLPDLDENHLDEPAGLANDTMASSWGITWYCLSGGGLTRAHADGPVDWNCDGDETDMNIAANVNNGGSGAACGCSMLRGHESWNRLELDLVLTAAQQGARQVASGV